METILTPAQAKTARTELGLSQAKITNERQESGGRCNTSKLNPKAFITMNF